MKKQDRLLYQLMFTAAIIGATIGLLFVFFMFRFIIGNALENNGFMYKSDCHQEQQPRLVYHMENNKTMEFFDNGSVILKNG